MNFTSTTIYSCAQMRRKATVPFFKSILLHVRTCKYMYKWIYRYTVHATRATIKNLPWALNKIEDNTSRYRAASIIYFLLWYWYCSVLDHRRYFLLAACSCSFTSSNWLFPFIDPTNSLSSICDDVIAASPCVYTTPLLYIRGLYIPVCIWLLIIYILHFTPDLSPLFFKKLPRLDSVPKNNNSRVQPLLHSF